MITAVIIDDDQETVLLLEHIFFRNFECVLIKGKAHTVIDGIKLIQKENPDFIILDIMLPDGTGFDLLECIPNKEFKTIFMSSDTNFAYRAIKNEAFDFIVKPFNIKEISLTINKLIKASSSKFLFLTIQTMQGKQNIDQKDIVYIKGNGAYSIICKNNNDKLTISQTLSQTTKQLCPCSFLRIHKSWIVNIKYIKELTNTHKLILNNNTIIPISKTYKEIVKKKFAIH